MWSKFKIVPLDRVTRFIYGSFLVSSTKRSVPETPPNPVRHSRLLPCLNPTKCTSYKAKHIHGRSDIIHGHYIHGALILCRHLSFSVFCTSPFVSCKLQKSDAPGYLTDATQIQFRFDFSHVLNDDNHDKAIGYRANALYRILNGGATLYC